MAALKFAACRHVRGRTDLSPLARLLLEEPSDRQNAKRGCAWPSREFPAARLGRGLTRINAAIGQARRAGLLGVGKSARRARCGYRHTHYVIDLERLAALDPDRAGDGVGPEDGLAPRSRASRPRRPRPENRSAAVGESTKPRSENRPPTD
jgi:hypothetical protein